jgi:hypothetical protein
MAYARNPEDHLLAERSAERQTTGQAPRGGPAGVNQLTREPLPGADILVNPSGELERPGRLGDFPEEFVARSEPDSPTMPSFIT